jgi:putative ABC transport system permease protein
MIKPGRSFRVALRIIRAVSVLVPTAHRAEWKREWEGELWHFSARGDDRRNGAWRPNMGVITRAVGSIPDAAWIRRQFTLDADAVQDATHATRMLVRTPGFTSVALLIFAIGIGAATAIGSMADALMLRPMVIPQPDRVITVWQQNQETGRDHQDVAPGNALDWMKRAATFESVAIAEPWTFNTVLPGRDPEYLPAAKVSEQFFRVLGATMFLGRSFLPEEYRPGAERVAILGYSTWRDRFGSDRRIVGRAARLDNTDSYTVVGVMPLGLELRLFDSRAQRPEPFVWLPKQGFDDVEPTLRGGGYWNVIGRLRSDVSEDDARAEFNAVSAQLAREYPQTNANIKAHLIPLRAHLLGSLRHVLPLILAASATLLLVACANIANLQLARGAARGQEFAVRQALGANRLRLVRQMLTETLLLASVGGAAGLAIARWTLDAIAALRPLDVAQVDRIPIDFRAALIGCGVTVFAAIAAGLTPAIQLSRPAASSTLKGWRTNSRRALRGALVSVEIAAAVVLVVTAALVTRSFVLVQRVNPGFNRDNVALLQVFASPRINTPEKRVSFFGQALERIRMVPGVSAIGGVTSMPFGEAKVIIRAALAIGGRPPIAGEQSISHVAAVEGDYFRVMGVPLLKGRLFEAADSATSRQVLLVSRTAARQFWPSSDPIGSRVRFGFAGTPYDAEVVGIVGDVQHEALDGAAPPEVYVPYAQSGFRALTIVVRTSPGTAPNLQAFKEQIWALDPLQSIFIATTLDHLVSKTLIGRRFALLLFGGFALVTLLLAAAGVYGVMSFTTTQRTREFGVRMALGADRRDIIRLVLCEGLTWSGVGVVTGVAIALPLMKFVRALLFGVTPTDPMTFLVVSLGLVLIALAACYIPARRALRVAPVEALRID